MLLRFPQECNTKIGRPLSTSLGLLAVLCLTQCASLSRTSRDAEPEFDIAYTVDKTGVFLYDVETGKRKKIYTTDRVFVDGKMEFINDSLLVVGHQDKPRLEEKERLVYSKYLQRPGGDSVLITENPPFKTWDEHYYVNETYFAIHIHSGKAYRYMTIEYEHIEGRTLNIHTVEFESSGQIRNENDTTLICGSLSFSGKGVAFCEPWDVAKSENVDGRHVYCWRGDLYMINGKDTSILLDSELPFRNKDAIGYFEPTLSPDGKRVTFHYHAGYGGKGSGLYEMDIDTKEKKELIGRGYYDPRYSPEGKVLLIGERHKSGKRNTWIRNIHVLDIETGTTKKIGKGDLYLWIAKK